MVDHLKQKLAELNSQGGLRVSRPLNVQAWQVTDVDNQQFQQPLINFSSNDYLGLASSQSLIQEFFASHNVQDQHNWMSASSARPLTGTSIAHEQLEVAIARDYGKDKALLFNSGYHANSGILPALTDKHDLILADKLVHASIIDGLRLGEAKFKRFAHNDMAHLERLLTKYSGQYKRIWVVTESVFSMDGDIASLEKLVGLKKQFPFFLYVDEAHAIGCYGQRGLGIAEYLGLLDDIDVLIGVFGKALAGVGAFVTAEKTMIDCLINYSRSWLFSTALPPINVQWNYFIWQKLSEFDAQRQQLFYLTQLCRQQLAESNLICLGESYIVPLLKEGNEAAVASSQALEKHGFLALPIRSPTVKKGSERVRFSLTANLPEESITALVDALSEMQ